MEPVRAPAHAPSETSITTGSASGPSAQAPSSVRSANGKAATNRANLEKELGKVEGKRWVRRLLILAGVLTVVAIFIVWRAKTRPPPPPKYVLGETSQGDVIETVQSTGQVKPLTEVQVGAQVSGRITKVFVDFNSIVKKGDLLAEIDPTLFGAAIDQGQAGISAAKANVAAREAQIATAKQRLDRAKKLVTEGIAAQSELDAAQGEYDVALADAAAAKANVAQLGAQLRSSRTNLDYTRIYAPIDGMVTNRAIDPGQTVAASFQAPVLFVIAQDLSKMRVLADIDEADVGRVKEKLGAEVTVDAFPGEKFKGMVSQVRFSPTTQSGVTTYAAVIEVENPELKLRPGMTATVKIKSNEAKGVTRVPNAALRFKPSPPVDKEGKKIPQDPLPALGANRARVYVLTNDKPGQEVAEVREVDVGITDGINTVLKTDLHGQKVVIDENDDPNKPKKPF